MVLVLVKPLVKKFFAVLVFKKSPNVFTSPQGTLFFDSISNVFPQFVFPLTVSRVLASSAGSARARRRPAVSE